MADTIYATVDLVETSKNENPPPGFQRIQAKPDGLLYVRDSQGVEYVLNNMAGGGSSFVPTLIEAGETFLVPENKQALFKKKITLEDGAKIKLDGILVEVN